MATYNITYIQDTWHDCDVSGPVTVEEGESITIIASRLSNPKYEIGKLTIEGTYGYANYALDGLSVEITNIRSDLQITPLFDYNGNERWYRDKNYKFSGVQEWEALQSANTSASATPTFNMWYWYGTMGITWSVREGGETFTQGTTEIEGETYMTLCPSSDNSKDNNRVSYIDIDITSDVKRTLIVTHYPKSANDLQYSVVSGSPEFDYNDGENNAYVLSFTDDGSPVDINDINVSAPGAPWLTYTKDTSNNTLKIYPSSINTGGARGCEIYFYIDQSWSKSNEVHIGQNSGEIRYTITPHGSTTSSSSLASFRYNSFTNSDRIDVSFILRRDHPRSDTPINVSDIVISGVPAWVTSYVDTANNIIQFYTNSKNIDNDYRASSINFNALDLSKSIGIEQYRGYSISYDTVTGGTISGVSDINQGGSITVTTTPDTKYTFDYISISPASGGTVSGTTISNIHNTLTVTGHFLNIFDVTYSTPSHGTLSGPSTVIEGNSITVTPTADTGYHFDHLEISPASSGTVSGTTISNVSSNITVSAIFTIDTYNVTYSTPSHGTVSGPSTVQYGGSITVTPTPNTGYHFNYIEISPADRGTVSGTTISNITGNISVSTVFEINTYNITYTTCEHGIVTGPATVQHNGDIYTTTTADTGYHFDHLEISPASGGTVDENSIRYVKSDITVTAVFTNVCNVTYVQSMYGTMSGPSTVMQDTESFTVTWEADPQYPAYRLQWLYDQEDRCTIDGLTVSNVTGDIILNGWWNNYYYVHRTYSPHGSIQTSSSIVEYGSSVTVTATPDTGYALDHLEISPATGGTVSGMTISNITDDIYVTGVFTELHNITYATPTGGTISGPATVIDGNSITVTATPDTGYIFDSLTVSGSGTVSGTTISNITSDITVNATFIPAPYTITYFSANGEVTGPIEAYPTTAGGVAPGPYTFTATPDRYYEYQHAEVLEGDCELNSSTKTITNVRSNIKINVRFSLKTYYITIEPVSHGYISANTAVRHIDGTRIFPYPDEGYWYDNTNLIITPADAATLSEDKTYLDNFESNLTISGYEFKQNEHTITYSQSVGGTISGPSSAHTGRYITVNTTPNTGYYFDHIEISPASGGTVSGRTISNITSSITVTGVFTTNTRSLSYSGSHCSASGPSTATINDTVVVNVTPDSGYGFDHLNINPASGGTVSGNTISNITSNLAITAVCTRHNITYTASHGLISGPSFAAHNGSLNINQTPDSHYIFDGISISPASGGTVSGTTVSDITNDLTITGSFVGPAHDINYIQTTGGTISGPVRVLPNGSITVTATPATGYSLSVISISPTSAGTVSGNTISNITSDINVSATFIRTSYSISYSTPSYGTISGPSTVAPGGSITVITSADSGYALKNITSTGGTVSGTTISDINSDITVGASFTSARNIVYATVTGGTTSGPIVAATGGSISVTAIPNQGYAFSHLEISPANAGIVNGLVISDISADFQVVGVFGQGKTITYATVTGGTITGPTTVVEGDSITVTATPATGYHFNSISISPASGGTVSGTTISNITENITVTGSFSLDTYNVTYATSTGGIVTGPATVQHGESITVTATPSSSEYGFVRIDIDPASAGTVSGTTISNVTGNITVTGVFTRDLYTINYVTVPNGVLSGPATVPQGGSITIVATPATGYQLASYSISPAGGGTISGMNITNISTNISVIGVFVPIVPPTTQYNITYQSVTGGSATGPSSISAGGSFTVVFTADANYTLSSWTTQGICVEDHITNTISSVYSDIIVIPTFVPSEPPGPEPPGTVYDLGWRPMWYDTNTSVTTAGTTNSVYVQAIINGNNYIADELYYCRPNLNVITVDLNKLVGNIWEAPAFNTVTSVRSNNTLRFLTGQKVGDVFTPEYEWDATFVPDWSWTNVNFDNFNPISKPFNVNLVNGQYFPYSVLQKTGSSLSFSVTDPDGITATYTPTANRITDYVIPINKNGRWIINGKVYDTFCADYVLYYVNSFGGWDSIALEGNTTGRRDYNRTSMVSHKDVTSNYKNKITKSYDLKTGWMTDDQSMQMYNVFGTTRAILHDIKNNTLLDVVITDTNSTDKTFKNQGRQLVRHNITVSERQIKTRR